MAVFLGKTNSSGGDCRGYGYRFRRGASARLYPLKAAYRPSEILPNIRQSGPCHNGQDQEPPLPRATAGSSFGQRLFVSSKIHGSPVSFYAVDALSAHTSIAETCLVYLRQFDKPLALPLKPPESYCLARYAAKHWPHHVQAVVRAAERLFPIPTDRLFKAF